MPTGVFVDEERWIGGIVCCFVSLMSDVCAWRGLLTLSEDETDKSAAALNHITAPWRSAFCHLGGGNVRLLIAQFVGFPCKSLSI